jgi:hypothetical protein
MHGPQEDKQERQEVIPVKNRIACARLQALQDMQRVEIPEEVMGDGWKRNKSGLTPDDFFVIFNVKGTDFFTPKDSEGLFDCTVFDAAEKNNLLIPTLEDVIDYIRINPKTNAKIILQYLCHNELLTSTGIEKMIDMDYFSVVHLEEELRLKKGFPPRKSGFMVFSVYDKRINMEDEKEVVYEHRNIIDFIFNREYKTVIDTLDYLLPDAPKKIIIPDALRIVEKPLTLLVQDNEILICENHICNGEFCVRY